MHRYRVILEQPDWTADFSDIPAASHTEAEAIVRAMLGARIHADRFTAADSEVDEFEPGSWSVYFNVDGDQRFVKTMVRARCEHDVDAAVAGLFPIDTALFTVDHIGEE